MNPPVALLLETSQRTGLVALATEAGVMAVAQLDDARRHVRDLASSVSALLESHSLTPRDVGRVVVGVGPGSYTGLRVGLASAKAFAYAVGCELLAVPTFAAIAERTPDSLETCDVIADALQGLVYHQRFHGRTAATALTIDTVADWLATAPRAVTGPGVGIHESLIPHEIHRVDNTLWVPTAESLWKASRNGTPVTREELFALEPLYLRGSSAEEKRRRESSTPVN